MTEVWAAVITTDRPVAFAELCADLLDRTARADVRLRLVVLENSVRPESRAANTATLESLPLDVHVDTTRGGEAIAFSRCRLRDQIAAALHRQGRPRLVWMLDDDVRLTHVAWSGGRLESAPLHNHVEHLVELAHRRPDIGVLIGDVTGDPPIPAVATLATRLSDLAHNLRCLFEAEPEDPWVVDDGTLRTLAEPDAYYDLSVERRPPWLASARWLPRMARNATASTIWEEIGRAVPGLPFGVASTRPILARPHDFETFGESTRRGGNAVFFDVDACVEHEYPSIDVAGVTTRRSDMIGTRLLHHRRPGRVRSSGFSVAHSRPTDGPWPAREDMNRGLVGDTFGALLAREVDAAIFGRDARGFVPARVERLRLAASRLREAVQEVAHIIERAPPWANDVERVTTLLGWIDDAVPTGQGDLPSDLESVLTDPAAHAQLADYARDLVGNPR